MQLLAKQRDLAFMALELIKLGEQQGRGGIAPRSKQAGAGQREPFLFAGGGHCGDVYLDETSPNGLPKGALVDWRSRIAQPLAGGQRMLGDRLERF
jgi:hypothetical protein